MAALPAVALNAGSSEIRNWIVLAGMLDGLAAEFIDYAPIYRTPAGTGIGVAFAAWR